MLRDDGLEKSKEMQDEIRKLPDEIVDIDGADRLPKEIIDDEGLTNAGDALDKDFDNDTNLKEVTENNDKVNKMPKLPDEISDDIVEKLPDEIVDAKNLISAEMLDKQDHVGIDYYNNVRMEQNATDKSDNTQENKNDVDAKNTYSDLATMKKELGKNYGEIKADKPPNSPNIAKWFENGGGIKIEDVNGKKVWTYIDKNGREVKYVDGYPVFPPEAKHPVIGDISIGEFTGDRNEDKKLYLKALEEQYGLTEIPEGYALHHDSENGNMQLVKEDWHKEFRHAGGHSLYKED